MSRSALLLLFIIASIFAIGFTHGAARTEAGILAVAAAEETQTCPRCGSENKAGLNFCVKCGMPLKEEVPAEKTYCLKCGAENVEGAKFCTTCGYSLTEKKPAARAAFAHPPKKALYFTGGLASYGGNMVPGDSWAVGGDFTIPLLANPGANQPSLEISTEAGFSMVNESWEVYQYGPVNTVNLTLISIRGTALLSQTFGPRKMIKPFFGLGAGAAILVWECESPPGHTYDDGTNVKALFDIPLGCEFYVTPDFALGAKADYLIIQGDIEIGDYYKYYKTAPNVFLLGGTARFCF